MVKTLKRLWPAMAVPCLLFCLATAVPAQARAEEDFQKLEDVLRHAWRGNPRIQAAREELRGKYELVPQARAGWKPTAEASANVTKAWLDGDNFGGGGSTSKQLGVTMSEPLYRGGRTVAATRSARATVTAQTALLNDAEQQLMLEVATAYMDVLRAGAQLRLAENYKTLIGRQLDGSRARFRAGDATMTDVSQGEARGAEADALIAAARGNLNKSGAVYAGLTGLQPGTMGYPQLSFAFPPTRDAAVEQARRDNPVIVASRSLQEASEADIDTIFGELLPRLALNGSWDRQYDPQPGLVDKATARSVALVLTVPLYEAGATRSRVRQAKHEANRRYLALLSAGRDAERGVNRRPRDHHGARRPGRGVGRRPYRRASRDRTRHADDSRRTGRGAGGSERPNRPDRRAPG